MTFFSPIEHTGQAVDFAKHLERIRPEVYDIPMYQDDRGVVYCVRDNLFQDMIQRTYIVENHSKGLVRAWHVCSIGEKNVITYL